MTAYLDSSIVLRYIFSGEEAIRHDLDFPSVVSSELLDLSKAVRQRAREVFPLNIRTVDALHLSTALLRQRKEESESVHVFSHDSGMNLCARALGLGTPLM